MHYLENVTNDSRDKRILNMFMGIVSDLNLFRRELRKISKNFVDNLLDTIFAKWKKLSEPSHVSDINFQISCERPADTDNSNSPANLAEIYYQFKN